MLAGTITIFDDVLEEPLQSWFRDHGVRAIEVEDTQTSFDKRPIQRGLAAGSVTKQTEVPTIAVNGDGERDTIVTEPEEQSERLLTEWVADPTETGLLAIESVDGDGEFDFPLDLFAAKTGARPLRQIVDVEAVHMAWDDEDALGDVWLNASDDGTGAAMAYHQQADDDQPATIGLGFRRAWSGTVMRGVVYESGYLAIYNCSQPAEFVRFVDEELLEYCEPRDDNLQATLGNSTPDPECERCGRESDSVEKHDGADLCVVCRDAIEKEGAQFENGGDP